MFHDIPLNKLIIIGAAVVIFLLAAAFIMSTSKSQKKFQERIKKMQSKYSQTIVLADKFESSLKKKQNDMLMKSRISGLPSITKLREKLDRTGRNVSIAKYFIGSFVVLILGTLIFKMVLGFGLLLATLGGIFLALIIPHFVISRWEFKRMKKFMMILPDAIDLIVRGLRSGLPVTESVSIIATEIQDPVKTVFADVTQSVRIGVPFEKALLAAAKKLDLNEFNFFVISIALQRETGGNLAEILENLSVTIRARAMMKLKVKAITSEARASAYIVGSLPFFVMIALTFISPGYLAPLTDDVRGNIAAGVAASMFTFGMFIMMKMAKFQI